MDEQTKKKLQDGGKHLLHGVEDAADVIGHTAVGAVDGVAEGVESASAASKTRDAQPE
jgi:hypothetical protein